MTQLFKAFIYVSIKISVAITFVDTFLIVGPYSCIQKTQFEILSFPPERRVNVCLCWYGFFHINWPCAAFLLSELKSVERASSVQVSVASFYYTHFKDRLLRRNIAWMMVNSDSGRQSTMELLSSYPDLQISMAASPVLSSLFVHLYPAHTIISHLQSYCHLCIPYCSHDVWYCYQYIILLRFYFGFGYCLSCRLLTAGNDPLFSVQKVTILYHNRCVPML